MLTIANQPQATRRAYTSIPYSKIAKMIMANKSQEYIARKTNRYNEGRKDPLQEIRGIISRMRTTGFRDDKTGQKFKLTHNGLKVVRGPGRPSLSVLSNATGKRRGRPVGSKNRPKGEVVLNQAEKPTNTTGKRRGRPVGSKNKPKVQTTVEFTPVTLKKFPTPGRPSTHEATVQLNSENGMLTLKVPQNSVTIRLQDLRSIVAELESLEMDTEVLTADPQSVLATPEDTIIEQVVNENVQQDQNTEVAVTGAGVDNAPIVNVVFDSVPEVNEPNTQNEETVVV